MRNISQLVASAMLLATQANTPFTGVAAASAQAPATAETVYEVSLQTNTSSPIVVAGQNKPNYEAEVLSPLHAAQAEVARKLAAARAKAKPIVRAKAPVSTIVAVTVPGTHTDWMRAAGIAESDFGYVNFIIDHESGWGVTKSNYGGSGAYGLGQALPASKMARFGADYLTNPITQLRWADAYAKGSYGSWASAYSHWLARHSW
jgi:hypothetical protein